MSKKRGGGVLYDLSHEFDLLKFFFRKYNINYRIIDILYTINHDMYETKKNADECDVYCIKDNFDDESDNENKYNIYNNDKINLKTFMVRFDTKEECGITSVESEYNDEYYYDVTHGKSVGIFFSFIDYKKISQDKIDKKIKNITISNLDNSDD